jgi:hypothetical protein
VLCRDHQPPRSVTPEGESSTPLSVLQVPFDEAVAVPEPSPVAGQGCMPCTVAVVSDGSALTHRGLAGGAESVEPVPELVIITPDQTSWALLVLPGLLRAAATALDPKFDIAGYHACALALVAATPPDRLLPDPRDPALTNTIEQATTGAIS